MKDMDENPVVTVLVGTLMAVWVALCLTIFLNTWPQTPQNIGYLGLAFLCLCLSVYNYKKLPIRKISKHS